MRLAFENLACKLNTHQTPYVILTLVLVAITCFGLGAAYEAHFS